MLIDLKYLVNKYHLHIKGILHCGGHTGEEHSIYSASGINHVVWVECIPECVALLHKRFVDIPTYNIINEMITDKDNIEHEFYQTDNNASSSMLQLGTHEHNYPNIKVVKTYFLKSISLDSLIEKYEIDITKFNFLNLDIQGAELLALKGFVHNLQHIDYIYTEFNTEEVYKGCSLLNDLDKFLKDYKRVETKHTAKGWGDCFYIRQ